MLDFGWKPKLLPQSGVACDEEKSVHAHDDMLRQGLV